MAQMLLFADPRPLDERLGKGFFREAPRRPGVYVMRDAEEKVLYVGKAKDLRQRLRHYRAANPDRMPRRHLRMVREVASIEFEFCRDETSALRREARLLRSLRPPFNRAGVWPGKTCFLVWRRLELVLELGLVEAPETGWERVGPLGGGGSWLHGALARLLWLAMNPGRAWADLPAGWAGGGVSAPARILCGAAAAEAASALAAFFWGRPEGLEPWLAARLGARTHSFERAAVEGDLEILRQFAEKSEKAGAGRSQMALL